MPTTAIATYGAGRVDPLRWDEAPVVENLNLKASTAFAAGTIVGEIAASPGTYGPYATGNSDGTQLPTHILQYACQTDASGNITLGTGTAGQEWGQTKKGAPAYVPGAHVWNCADLPNLDAGAVTALRGHLLQGTVTAGRVVL